VGTDLVNAGVPVWSGCDSEEGASESEGNVPMRVAGMIVTTAPGQADEVARHLGRVQGIRVYGIHRDVDVVLVAEAYDEEQIENLSGYIRWSFDGVRSVCTTLVPADLDAPVSGGHPGGAAGVPPEPGKEPE
jgi:nitrate reductase NapAB chaperone NapD